MTYPEQSNNKLIYNGWDRFGQIKDECKHLNCPEGKGTGRKKDGTRCIHMISCNCSRCSPRY